MSGNVKFEGTQEEWDALVKKNNDANADLKQWPEPKEQPLTYGMKAVGIGFNPSGDQDVARAKMQCANLIDQMDALRARGNSPEQKRLASIAITELQGAQMWAVKAITWKD